MNVLVIGCGLLGRKIARTMDEMGWDVSVLSNIESDLELLENDFEGVTFRGFPMDIRNLREAGIELSDFVRGNEKARERMKAQYSIAGMTSGVVVGTDHAAEAITGFFTKYGDGGTDINPLYRLNKRQGKQLLAALGCPEHLYKKAPTADLEDDRPSLPDEVALGVTYDNIDDYLEGKNLPEQVARTIENWYLKTEHKRRPPITVFDDFWKK